MTLEASNAGYRFYFDLTSMQWVSQSQPQPGVTPTLLLPDWTLKLTKEEWTQALNKWRSQGVTEYQMAISIDDGSIESHLRGDYGFRVSESEPELDIFKRMPRSSPKHHSEGYDGSLETTTVSTNWQEFLQNYTVESLFAKVGAMIDDPDPEYCRVAFDPTYGFPSDIQCKNRIDDTYAWVHIRVSSFEALKQLETPVP